RPWCQAPEGEPVQEGLWGQPLQLLYDLVLEEGQQHQATPKRKEAHLHEEQPDLSDAWLVGTRASARRPGRKYREGQPRRTPEEDALECRDHRRRDQPPHP